MDPLVESVEQFVGSFWPEAPRRPLPLCRTYIVMGHAHGGTSMIAGLLRLAGVPMGTQIDPTTSEDIEFRQRRAGALRRLIERRNGEHAVWGWKAPDSIQFLPQLLPDVRSPHLIMIVRDPFATTRREAAQGGVDDLMALTSWKESFEDFLGIIRARKCPTLFVSYEKTIRRPEQLVRLLEMFLGESWTADQRNRLAAFVTPRGGYQSVNRVLGVGPRPLPPHLARPFVYAGDPPETGLAWRRLRWRATHQILRWNDGCELQGNDPWSLVADEELAYLTGSHWYQIKLKLPPDLTIRPQFYFDFGDGFNETHSVHLPELGSGTWSFRLHLPPPLCGLRFDPHDAVATIDHFTMCVATDRSPTVCFSGEQRHPVPVAAAAEITRRPWRALRLADASGVELGPAGAVQMARDVGYVLVHEAEIPLLAGQNWLQVDLELQGAAHVRPRFFCDLGSGFIDEHSMILPPLASGACSFRVDLPAILQALRFDPHDRPAEIKRLILRTTTPDPSDGPREYSRDRMAGWLDTGKAVLPQLLVL